MSRSPPASVLVGEAHAGLADHDARFLDRIGQHLLVRRKLEQIGLHRVRQVGIVLGHPVGRKPVRLGEDDVEADDDGAHGGQSVDQPRHFGARPRPLSDKLKALLVDVDNRDRLLRRRARVKALEDVEALVADAGDEKRIGHAQAKQQEQQNDTSEPRQGDAHRSG